MAVDDQHVVVGEESESESVYLTQGAFGEIRLKAHHQLGSRAVASSENKGRAILVAVKSIRNAFVVAKNNEEHTHQDTTTTNNKKAKENEEGERLLSSIMLQQPTTTSDVDNTTSVTVVNTNDKFPYKLSRAAVREVTALKYLTEQQHESCLQKGDEPRIVPLLDIIPPKPGDLSPTLGLVMPYCSIDLAFILQTVVRPNGVTFEAGFDLPTMKRFSKDILAALEFCHSRKIMHRDVKPSNFLLSSQGILQLADFGLAKSFASLSSLKGDNNMEGLDVEVEVTLLSTTTNEPSRHPELEATNGICSLHYRPPEIMFGCTTYGPEVDVFSAGLIVAELYNVRPLLPGLNVLDQISLQTNTLGTPPPTTFSNGDLVSDKWPDYGKLLTFAPSSPIPLANLIPRSYCDPMGQKLIQAMLQMDPTNRPSTKACLQHSWFLNGDTMASRHTICSQFLMLSSSMPRNAPSCMFPVVVKNSPPASSEAILVPGTNETNTTTAEEGITATADWDMPFKWHTTRIGQAWNHPGEGKGNGVGRNATQNSISGININQVYARRLKKGNAL
jgi:serine/threonine protein kinase